MRVKHIIYEDFVNYKKTSMFIGTVSCDFKCCTEQNLPLSTCQNQTNYLKPIIEIDNSKLIETYLANPITEAIVFGGLEPFLQFSELYDFIFELRYKYNCQDDVIIYTGYNKPEILSKVIDLTLLNNIIIKYGRFIPGQKPHLDPILNVYLASDNQYAEKI